MATLSRFRSLLVTLGFLVAVLVAMPGIAAAQEGEETESPAGEESPAPAEPQPAAGEAECAATGYLADSEEAVPRLRGELSEESVQKVGGVPLRSGQTWVIPDGSQPVVVLDSTGPVSGGEVWVSLAGQEFEAATDSYAETRERYIPSMTMPHLGPTVRSLGLRVGSGQCEVAVALSVDRSVWSTLAGGAAIVVTALFGLLTVLVARLRRGGWVRRFGFAAPLGLVAGLGQGVVLLEAGVVDPFAVFPWWAPVAGLGLAALLPLTRWGGRRVVPAGGVPASVEPAPQAPLAGFRIEALVARSEVAGVYRATRVRVDGQPPAEERALVKVALAGRFGEPVARMRMEREASALAGLEHPNVLRLREVVPAEAGAPTLVFEDVDGIPLRWWYERGGSLSGAQVLTVMLGVLVGLQMVHGRELVHRDVRPENVWITGDGRVLLGGFELACAGVEHPVAPEATEPYASAEQRAGQVLDARSDLYACGVMLRELMPEPVPTPVRQLLDAVLAEDPGGRPGSADQLAAGLRAAAEQAYGPDWVGRGALAGAVATNLAVGAAAAGYTLAGGAAATGAAAGAGTAGAGAGLGVSQAGSLGVAGVTSSGAPTAAAAPVAPAGGAAAGGGSSGLGVVANAAAAVVAGAAIVVGAVLVDPDPAQARSEVITPEQARVIFIRTVDEGRAEDDLTHIAESVQTGFQELWREDGSLVDGPLTEVEVGVPRDQFEYPAWFVASALIPYEDGTTSVFARFDRERGSEPWMMTSFAWTTDRVMPAVLLDDDGWLALLPTTVEPVIDPEELPDRYADWVTDQGQAFFDDGPAYGEVVEYDQFEWLPNPDSYLVSSVDVELSATGLARPAVVVWPDGGGTWVVAREWGIQREEDPDSESSDEDEDEEPAPATYEDLSTIPLADGTALVSFVISADHTVTGEDDNDNTGPCGDYPSFRYEGTDYRVFATDYLVRVQAWVPLVEAPQARTATPTPAVTPSPSQPDPDDDPEEPDAEPILLADPIISTVRPSDRSEPC